jgi:hypothetical protein
MDVSMIQTAIPLLTQFGLKAVGPSCCGSSDVP